MLYVNYSCMTATIKEKGNLRIEDQNYGFGLENNIKQKIANILTEKAKNTCLWLIYWL